MSIRARDQLLDLLGRLRHEPIDRRLRGLLDGEVVVDSQHPLLVWEPRRIVCSYAVPVGDVGLELVPSGPAEQARSSTGVSVDDLSQLPILDPTFAFSLHTTPGEALRVQSANGRGSAAAFRPADSDLSGHVLFDFNGLEWYEEDVPMMGHPRDPFHRIDILASSRRVRIEHEGHLLAESTTPLLLFETMLPVRYYLERQDVRVDLQASDARTVCAYKGEATYFSPVVQGHVLKDLVWTYPAPLQGAEPIKDRVAFFGERLDVVVDGQQLPRMTTPWSRDIR